ncbi:MAG: FAD-binding and (Fe-S)-binding domain-containing protein, partial [Solirubrobacteraceae bacterium]
MTPPAAVATPNVQTATPPPPAPDRAPDWVAGGTPEPLRSRLEAALGSDQVLTRALDLIRYAGDASPYRMIPRAVAVPRDIDDLVALLGCATELAAPLVFRAAGTSLNGQGQTDSILVDVRRHWRRIRIEDGGARARVGPGAVLGHVNRLLVRHGRRLGPDPASTPIACVGGVIANNSGGMRCGVVADSYRTVSAMTLVLANGTVIDTAAADAERHFAAAAPELVAGLAEIPDQIRADTALAQRIAAKVEIKNTTGYRLCAFLDADTPLEIFRRLVVGSEGTLAFVAEAVFETVPLGRHTTLGLVGFEDLDAAADAVGPLVAAGATATELMVAPTLIAAAWNMPGTPPEWKQLPPTSAALLIEFRAEDPDQLESLERAALEILEGRPLLGDPPAFSRAPERVELLWRVREGMQGLLAALRPPGITMIIEDVCVRPARVAEAARDLQALLGAHGFLSGLAGHASAGNLHFILTADFTQASERERYDTFMHALVDLIIDKYDGSLKAEHGTGRNMAPFVEREWGPVATGLMWRVKQLADPAGVLGPGIVLNRDPGVHLRNLKSVPEVEESVTKCIECGFCEAVCPSQNLTTTPRQRIVLRRELARQPEGSPVQQALLEQYDYDAIQTCAVDGSCRSACPVAIDTGELIKDLRVRSHSERSERIAGLLGRRYACVERAARLGLRVATAVALRVGDRPLVGASAWLRGRLGAELVP